MIETPSQRLAVAELAIYALFSLLGIFNFIKHGRHGWLGWFFFLAFCLLRLTGQGMSINSSSSSAAIVSSIGISALILAVLGITHECSKYTKNYKKQVEWAVIIFLHVVVSTGIILVAIGGSHLSDPAEDPKKSQNLMEGGYILVLLGLLLVTGYIIATWRILPSAHQAGGAHASSAQAKTMALAVICTLPFIYARVIFGVVSAFKILTDPSLSPFNGSFVVKLVPMSLMQIFAALILVVGGLLTRNIASKKAYEPERPELLLSHF
ncbi:hypothetical protein EJ05DRAFT_475218 [Pseudovirgaria hyperparasitica]|uniref:DUF7702 domain-containing protein n=1 Tax=Pseudovirgaria hyperparasitica TaxID=470096 RepID=A0A6A6W8J9_9PEZI|nr:uncharacterized protein EJ05DRAFT_475218 [Pseudovirgaria hyperparasitica]KAF2758983.1 hypothetical protein EJ05DRAFT_475218 [Pseudovirgaria hyperparasitica]